MGGSSRKRSKAKQHGMEESERQLAARAIYIHGRGWLQMVSHVARVQCRWLAAGHESNPGTSSDLGPDPVRFDSEIMGPVRQGRR